jgi:hypothetical protein
MSNNREAFLALVRAGLWEKEARLSPYKEIDYSQVLSLAEEQAIVGLVAAGLEHVVDVNAPKTDVLQFVGQSLQIEQRNAAMNKFLASLVKKIVSMGLNPIVIKGQGIAQCYERPLWRSSGDIDLLFSQSQYNKAKNLLLPLSTDAPTENDETLECCFYIQNWAVEVHGSLNCLISRRADKMLGDIQNDVCEKQSYRVWKNGQTEIFLPSIDNDVLIIFTHIIKHFFRGGIGLRQICDWCRLLFSFRDDLDREKLSIRLKDLGLVSEWKVFAAFAVYVLGMPESAMPFFDASKKWKSKVKRILPIIINTGNFGHNRDVSYQQKYPVLLRKVISLCLLTGDSIRNFFIFPLDTVRAWGLMFTNKMSL